ncbi:MAG TPA: helical backbone metal receptor [Woeseiaceae bacterium]|nr:helical backbone metal receptor [Woeseiaceae bacterium]
MRRRAAAIPILAAAVLCSGCGNPSGAPRHPGGEPPSARRIVTLAPHLAELVFAVGAGDRLVGVSAYTDRPQAAAALPVVGDAFSLDQERLALLEPDLLLAWESGTPAHVVDELRGRGYRVASIRTRGLGDVAAALERIGALTGQREQASRAAAGFRAGLERLAARYGGAPPISVFYQVSQQPLYTINGEHYVSELVETCGGRNVFAEIGELAPMVSVEAVLARNPEVMLASSDSPPDAFAVWQRWPDLAANRFDNYFRLPANEIGRATPRLLKAGETLCRVLERAREHRAAAGAELESSPAFHL